MIDPNTTADLDAMADANLVTVARAAYEAACTRRTATQAAMTAATVQLHQTRDALTDLLQRAATGASVPPEESAAASAAVRDAEAQAAFLGDLAGKMDNECQRLDTALRETMGASFAPVAAHGAKLRLAAAARLDAARAELAAAEAEYRAAGEIINHAASRGFRLAHRVPVGTEHFRSAPQEAALLRSAGINA